MIDLTVGHYYRGKRPVPIGFFTLFVNDRKILWISADGETIQYDSSTVKFGRSFVRVSRTSFLKWAGADVTEEYRTVTAHEWQAWEVYQATWRKS